jgi:ribosomal protein S18 acetylase RimI-like enzyme
MELNEEIYRIKSLLKENSDPYKIRVISEIETDRGYCVYYLTENNDVIGVVTLTDLNKALENKEFNEDVKFLHENYDKSKNTAYLHSIVVESAFRKQGFGTKLVKECENIARNSGYKYITATVKKNNIPSQTMFNKLGYTKYNSNDKKDLFILSID